MGRHYPAFAAEVLPNRACHDQELLQNGAAALAKLRNLA